MMHVDPEIWHRIALFRVVMAVFLALPIGFWGVIVLFSNSNGMEGTPYVLFVSVTHFLPSVLVGAVARPAQKTVFSNTITSTTC